MPVRSSLRIAALVAAALCLAALSGVFVFPRLAASRVRAAARSRGLEARWQRLAFEFPARLRIAGLLVTRAGGDTVLSAEHVDVALRFAPLLIGRARPAAVSLSHVALRLAGPKAAEADTLAPEEESGPPAVAERVRARANAIVGALLAPARRMPTLHLEDVSLSRGAEGGVALDALDLAHGPEGVTLAVNGTLLEADPVPFDVVAAWHPDDRLDAQAEFRIPDPDETPPRTLVMRFEGRMTQDSRAREVRIAEGSSLKVGELSAHVSARVRAAGPAARIAVEADGLTAAACRRSLPLVLLGPLAGLEVRGSWDWRAGLDLDLDHPDSVRFHAGVTPHGLWLDPAASRPSLQAIALPFTASIHLPHDRIVTRDLSPANPHFRPLDRISPLLRDAVITNEDGGFWHHRGFNPEAITLAIAANLRSGSYKRGAGTITMQLARNLWLGHRRTLSRKAQEVVLAWLLEHVTGLTKERLLEIYLNIIEWGPDVHGADEAAHYYFDEDAADVTLPEALFLTIIVPSPEKWRWRFTPDGHLRSFARAQMHFIATKMAGHGWLDPARVPAADSLEVQLRGPARALFAAPDTLAAPASADSLEDAPA